MSAVLSVPNRWLVHAYYTVCPYAPDGSDRLLVASGNVGSNTAEVLILDGRGNVLDSFGDGPVEASFWHTGRWQTWSPDASAVYYTSGSLARPQIVRRELATGEELRLDGDLEGAPPADAPILSGLLGMLHAAGAGDGSYDASRAPVPFAARDRHGLFEHHFDQRRSDLVRSVAEILEVHPEREKLRSTDLEMVERCGDQLSLMAYCVRWTPDCSRVLFHFGNHLAANSRGEPRVGYVMTARPDLSEVTTAVDMSFGRRGVHWSWQPDGEHLIGYGEDPGRPGKACLAEVRHDGTGHRKISDHSSGGHPSVSPTDPDLVVTDEWTEAGGAVTFLSRSTGEVIRRVELPRFVGAERPKGRTPASTDHHPVFHPSGDRVLVNAMPGPDAVLMEIEVPR